MSLTVKRNTPEMQRAENSIDNATADFVEFRESVMQLLNFAKRILAGNHITIMDIGARNLTLEIPELAPVVDAYSFEPNPEEFRKLQDRQTDARRLLGISQPPYASCHYDPHAVHDRSGEAPLYITEGPGSCSLLEPNQEVLDRFAHWVGHDKPFGPEFRVVGQTPVPLTSVLEAADRFGLGHIDYLKLDTQGTPCNPVPWVSFVLLCY